MGVRILFVMALLGCKAKVAPEPEFVEPVLTLDSDGYYHASDVDLEGQATGLSNLTINGAAADQHEGNAWKHELDLDRGVTVIEVRGTDMRDDVHFKRQGVLSGEYDSPDETVENALSIRLNQGGLDKVGQLAAGLIVAEDLEAAVMPLNPLYHADFVFGTHVAADLDDLEFDPLQISTDPRSGVMGIEVVIPNLLVTIGASGEVIFIDYDTSVTLQATSAVITGDITAQVSNQGQLSMELVNTAVELEGFSYDLSLLPGDLIEGAVFADTLRGLIESTLVSQMEERVPALLEDTLSGLDFSFETELLGKQVGVAMTFADLYSDQDGLVIDAHLEVEAERGEGKDYRGYLFADSRNEPNPSRTSDLGLSVSDNLLNNLLLQVWRSGILDLDLDSAEGELEPALLTQLGARGAARVIVDARVPPVFVERNGQAQLQVTELIARIETPGGDNGEYVEAAVTAFVDLQLTAEGGVLKLELQEPELVIDVRDSDWGISDNTLSDLLSEQLPINALLAALGGIEFPIPSLAGFTLNSAEAERDPSGVHTRVEATL